MIAVIGHLEVAAEQRADLVTSSADAVRLARAATGCLHYAVSSDPVQPDRVNVAELWASRDALEAFRGDGVDDETGAHIRAFHVQEYELA